MCYDARTSIESLSVGIVGAASLFLLHAHSQSVSSQEYKTLAVFLGFVTLMQFFDYVFWTNPIGTPANYYATKAAILVNHLQPLVLAGAAFYFTQHELGPWSRATLVMYLALALPYTWQALANVHGTTRSVSGPGLFWEWNYQQYGWLIYALFLSVLVAVPMESFQAPSIKAMTVFSTLFTFLFSMYKYSAEASVGRFWCYFASFIPLTALVQSTLLAPSV